MLLGIQLALLAMGVIVALRGRMGGARGHEVVGARARLGGLVLVAMAGTSIGMTHGADGTLAGAAEGVDRLAAIGLQGAWLMGAMVIAALVGGQGRNVEAAGGRRATA